MTINGYTIIGELKGENSGFSRWGFCERDGREYFIKEFLSPIYPYDAVKRGVLSKAQIDRKIEECKKFEERLIFMYEAINRASDGNSVRINHFFRCDSKYYIVTDKVKSSGLSLEEINALPYKRKKLLCKLISRAMMRLHEEGFVHADIKHTNVLVEADEEKKRFSPKIIDFDCGFFGIDPPKVGDELNGDPVYLAPEVLIHMMEEEVALSCKIDIFALGILFHQYMAGTLPGFDTSTYDYVAEAILDGAEVTLSPDIPEEFADIIYKMLLPNPGERISANEVYDMIQVEDLPEKSFGRFEGKSALPEGRKLPEGSKLKIYMGNKK